jgi:hypothetical protein
MKFLKLLAMKQTDMQNSHPEVFLQLKDISAEEIKLFLISIVHMCVRLLQNKGKLRSSSKLLKINLHAA